MKRIASALIVIVAGMAAGFAQEIVEVTSGHEAYYALIDSAELCIKHKEWHDAEIYLSKALRAEPANPGNSLLISNIATLQRYQQRYDDALNTYNQALSITPNAVALIKNRASLYVEMDSIDRAFADFGRIIELDPGEIEARYYHAMIAMQREDVDNAKTDVDALMVIDPKSPYSLEAKAKYTRRWGDVREALNIYTQQIKRAKNPPALLYSNRAECYLQLKLLNEAANDIRKALELAPDDAYLYLLRAKLNKLWYNEIDKRADITKAVELGIDRDYAERVVDGSTRSK